MSDSLVAVSFLVLNFPFLLLSIGPWVDEMANAVVMDEGALVAHAFVEGKHELHVHVPIGIHELRLLHSDFLWFVPCISWPYAVGDRLITFIIIRVDVLAGKAVCHSTWCTILDLPRGLCKHV